VPLPGFVINLLTEHQRRYPPALPVWCSPAAVVLRCAGPPSARRSGGRRARGLLGKIVEVGERKIMAHWHDGQGRECSQQFPTAREATEHLVKHGSNRYLLTFC
jgi:hypothetical protein